jgi:hypothetical protein
MTSDWLDIPLAVLALAVVIAPFLVHAIQPDRRRRR